MSKFRVGDRCYIHHAAPLASFEWTPVVIVELTKRGHVRVELVLPKGKRVPCDQKFRMDGSFITKSRYPQLLLVKETPANKEAAVRERFVLYLKHVSWGDMPTDLLKSVYASVRGVRKD